MDAWLIGVIVFLAYMVSVVLIGTRLAIISWEVWGTATEQRTAMSWVLFPLHTLNRQVGVNYFIRIPSDFLPIVWWSGRYYGDGFGVLRADKNAIFHYVVVVSFFWPVKVVLNAFTLSIIGVGYGIRRVINFFVGRIKYILRRFQKTSA